jgi:hypothetical protein
MGFKEMGWQGDDWFPSIQDREVLWATAGRELILRVL